MLLGLDLNHLLTFPIKERQARKNLTIGALLLLASAIIPILPFLPVLGYAMKIIRQVVAGQQPSMPEWDNWETLLKDGLKLFGVRLIYILPLMLVIMPIFLLFMLGPILGAAMESESMFVLTTFVIFPLSMICLMPVFIFAGVVIPVAEAHVAIQNEFSAGFRIREWWRIFRANIGGFLLAYLFIYAISMLLSVAFQILIFTVVLLCLLPIITPLLSMYIVLIQYSLIAAAYREGTLKQSALAANEQE